MRKEEEFDSKSDELEWQKFKYPQNLGRYSYLSSFLIQKQKPMANRAEVFSHG